MKKLLLTSAFLFLIYYSFSQSAGIRFSRTFGSTDHEKGYAVKTLSDGSSITVGISTINGIDITDNHGLYDIWVIKTNALGILEWKKSYGGSNLEYFRGILQNQNGTFTIFSQSFSNNGDVSGNHGNSDIWALNIDSTGNIIWQRSLGGSQAEEFRHADTTADGGCIIAGYSTSNNGDVTGNHGGEDIWIVKLSPSGNIEWQKSLGGTGLDRPRFIMPVADGNFIMVGSTASNDGDASGNHGSNDVWVVRMSSTGNITWQKTYGGSQSDVGYAAVFADNGSLTVLANTLSIDGDVAGRFSNLTNNLDVWVVNISYVNGSLNWQKPVGGSDLETPVRLFKNTDGSFLLAATTYSSDGDASNNHGTASSDVLLTRISNIGNIIWSKCFGGSAEETLMDIYHDPAGENYVFSATTYSDNGDVHGRHLPANPADSITLNTDAWVARINYNGLIQWARCVGGVGEDYLSSIQKSGADYYLTGGTSASDGDVPVSTKFGNDLWIVKLGMVNIIKGTLYLDNNANGIKEPGESYFSDAIVTSQKSGEVKSSIPVNGLFIHETDSGSYSTSVAPNHPYYSVLPSQFTSTFINYSNIDSFSFAMQPVPNKKDLTISIIPLTVARPGFNASYRLIIQNAGTTTIPAGEVLFKKDPRVNFISASPGITSSNGDTLVWAYTNLSPSDTFSILLNVQLQAPPAVNVGDTLSSIAIITPEANDETPFNDTARLKQLVVGAVDPNDKSELNEGVVRSSFISEGRYLQYTIRFQNTGTDTAFNVVIRDTLSGDLDWSTLQMVSASHLYALEINNGNQLTWRLNHIMLPDSNINEPASHGYIVFRIQPKNTVSVGTIIHNTAGIYFDFNLPVETSDASTLIAPPPLVVLPVSLLNFHGQVLQGKTMLSWRISGHDNFERFEIERSSNGSNFMRVGIKPVQGADYNFEDILPAVQPASLFYRLKMIDADGSFTYSRVLAFHKNEDKKSILIYPNPATSEIYLSFHSVSDGTGSLSITDAMGRMVYQESLSIKKGSTILAIHRSIALQPGIYQVTLKQGPDALSSKLLISK